MASERDKKLENAILKSSAKSVHNASKVSILEKQKKVKESNPFAGINNFGRKNVVSQNDIYAKDTSKDVISNNKINELPVNNMVKKNVYFNNVDSSINSVSTNIGSSLTEDKTTFINIDKKEDVKKSSKDKRKMSSFNILAYMVVIALWIIAIGIIISATRESYYFSEDSESNLIQSDSNNTVDEEMLKYEGTSKSGQVGGSSGEGITSIVYDNQYLKKLTLKNENDMKKLIVSDSVKQKENCPSNIIRIENDIIENYGIVAVNLCEMDVEFALELKDVTKYIYNNFPGARNYLTNLTLANVNEGSFMAAFMPVFTFATSNTDTGYPVAVKTQILLNAKYFLNNAKIKNSVNYGAKSGYFPPNATRSSTVAHEFGHYLSYVAMLNYYQSEQLNYIKASQSSLLYKVYDDFNEGNFSYALVNEAYQEYKKVYKSTSFDEFRKSISAYAVAKDGNGNYIYDETIAEAFHDVYLNGDLAQPASKYIVDILKAKL